MKNQVTAPRQPPFARPRISAKPAHQVMAARLVVAVLPD
jgi:hypothetical protein